MEIAILGLGCFWGPEIKFGKLDGVIQTEVGYCGGNNAETCLLYTSPSPRDKRLSRMPSSA